MLWDCVYFILLVYTCLGIPLSTQVYFCELAATQREEVGKACGQLGSA